MEEWSRELLGDEDRYSKSVEITVNEKRIVLHQRSVDSPNGTGNTVWDSGVLLTRFLEHHSLRANSEWNITGKKCLELGSGTGIVGISAAILGAKSIVLTDKYNVDLLEHNLLSNWRAHQHLYPHSQVKAMEYCWGDGGKGFQEVQESVKGSWDFILVADFLYDYRAVKSLLHSLLLFSTPLHTQSLLVYQIHDEESYEEFWDEKEGVEKYFQVRKIAVEHLPTLSPPIDLSRFHFLHLLRKPKY